MLRLLHRLMHGRSGATTVEYGQIAALVAVAVIVAVDSMGGSVSGMFTKVDNNLADGQVNTARSNDSSPPGQQQRPRRRQAAQAVTRRTPAPDNTAPPRKASPPSDPTPANNRTADKTNPSDPTAPAKKKKSGGKKNSNAKDKGIAEGRHCRQLVHVRFEGVEEERRDVWG